VGQLERKPQEGEVESFQRKEEAAQDSTEQLTELVKQNESSELRQEVLKDPRQLQDDRSDQ
jgi:hypothetical protein